MLKVLTGQIAETNGDGVTEPTGMASEIIDFITGFVDSVIELLMSVLGQDGVITLFWDDGLQPLLVLLLIAAGFGVVMWAFNKIFGLFRSIIPFGRRR